MNQGNQIDWQSQQNNARAQQAQWFQNSLEQQQWQNIYNGIQLHPLCTENITSIIMEKTWTCTNPACRKPLQLAKRGKDKHQAKGITILECQHCGFEFMVKADIEQTNKAMPKPKLGRIEFEIAALRKKVKDFELS